MEKQKLYLEIFSNTSNDDKNQILVTLETCIALFIFQYVGAPTNIRICFIQTNRCRVTELAIAINLDAFDYSVQMENEFRSELASNCDFPVIVNDEEVIVAGLCGVCRSIIKNADPSYLPLLGFKAACLLSPSEASDWTKFCEIDIVNCTKSVLLFHQNLNDSEQSKELEFHLPNQFGCFECHMEQPIRVHNIYKIARDRAKEQRKLAERTKPISVKLDELSLNGNGRRRWPKKPKEPKISSSVPVNELNIEHKYTEGQDITIADVVLFPQYWLMIEEIERRASKPLKQMLPLTIKWFEMLKEDERFTKCLNIFKKVDTSNHFRGTIGYQVANIEKFSLYKSEQKRRYKPKHMIFTHQNDIEESLAKINQLDIEVKSEPNENANDWETMSFEALPEDDDLPAVRVKRKKDQLMSLAVEVIKIACDGDRIVDFCSGTGHLGIILAYKLPKCQVYLLENKEESLMRAKQRVHRLQLTNVKFFQCNLDYFIGNFEIGTSLHACGTATDIVLKHCIDRRAKFVCCPCCYGKCEAMPHISYPRSKYFRANNISSEDFIRFAHCADQSHDLDKTINIEKTIQGQLCMDVVDTDRSLYAKECGYSTKLTRLYPEDCTPKNRLLIGTI